MPGIAITLKLLRSAAISAARAARRTFSAPIFMPGSSIVGHVDDVLRRQLAGGGHDRGADRDRRGGHRRLLDHVATLAAQRAPDPTTHDAQRVRRVDHGVDGQRPELALRNVNLHRSLP